MSGVEMDAFIGMNVQVWSVGDNEEHTDDGVLRAADAHWIVLRKENGDTLLFPTARVRLVKLLEPLVEGDEHTLMRAARLRE